MTKDPLQLVGILNDGDDFHIPAALWAHHRINLLDLCEKPGPGTLARFDGDFLVTVP